MAGIAFDDPLFAAEAGAATDWGSVSGGALVKVPIQLELNRGASLELGIQAMANLDARFQKFISAELAGEAQAQARVKGQIQMPMNLFREVGFAVRLHAILEASAGIRVGVGLSIGDFVDLAQSQLQLRGLPLTLFRIFLEEVDIGVSLYAKVAFTAQAYANLVATGTLVGSSDTGPGFNIVFGYGYGVKGGYGMRVVARAGLKDVSRYVARTVDVVVDHTIDELIEQMPAEDQLIPTLLDASRAPAKIAFRIGYELGEYIVVNDVPMTEEGAKRVALRCVQVALEESQRYLLRKMIDVGLDALMAYLREQFEGTDDASWNALRQAREELAGRLRAMPTEPFDLRDSETAGYWNDIAIRLTNIAIDVAGPSGIPPAARRDLATVWSAVQLMFAATVRLVRMDATVSVIGLPPAQAKASFEGPLSSQPHALIAEVIREHVPNAGTTLTQQDLLEFLTGTVVLDAVRSRAPQVDQYLEMFMGTFGATQTDVARLMMTSLGSIMKDDQGNFDDTAALREFAFGLRLFVSDKFEAIVVPAIRAAVPSHQPEPLMYVDEVLIPSMHMVMDSCFDQVVGWATGEVSQKALEEALSSVIMSIVGRTLVLTGDVMIAATQQQTVDVLTALAREPGEPGPANALIDVPSGFAESAAQIIAPSLPLSESEVAEGLREFLHIAADVAAPFPPHTRKKIRALMYDVLDPLPAQNPSSLAESLKNDLWIPNDQALLALGGELMSQVGERLVSFALRLLERLAEVAVEQLLEALDAAAAAVATWIGDIAAAIQVLVQRLAEIALELNALLGVIEDRVNQALDGLQSLLGTMSDRRDGLRTKVVDRIVEDATVSLDTSPLFMPLPPEVKTSARNAMRAAVTAAVANPILDPVFDAVSAIAGETNAFLDDVRALDPNAGLVTGIHALLLERIESGVLATFGGENPGIDIEFSVTWTGIEAIYHLPSSEYPLGRTEMRPKEFKTDFDLGRVELPVTTLFNFLADAIMSAGVVEQSIISFAQSVHALLIAELEELALKEERETVNASKALLEKQRAVADGTVLGVEIVEPAMTSVHGFSVPVAIVVEGVPPEYFRRGVETPDRALIYLDGEPMDLADFEIEAWSADTIVRRDDLGIARRPNSSGNASGGAGKAGWPIAPERRGEHEGATAVREAVSRQLSHRLHSGDALRPQRGTVVHHVREAYTGRPSATARRAPPMSAAPTGSDRSLAGGRGLGGRGSSKPGTSGTVDIGTRGSRPILTAHATGLSGIKDQPRSGSVLTATIPLASLDEGFHTLVVSVFDSAGREHRDAVAFVVETQVNATIKTLTDGGQPEFTRPHAKPIQREDVAPKRAEPRPIFPPRRERAARAKRAKDAVLARAVDPVARVAEISVGTRAVAAVRCPERTFASVSTSGKERSQSGKAERRESTRTSAKSNARSRKGRTS